MSLLLSFPIFLVGLTHDGILVAVSVVVAVVLDGGYTAAPTPPMRDGLRPNIF